MGTIVVAAVSGLVAIWSLVQLISHKIIETQAGMEIYSTLRGHRTLGPLFRGILREPLLGMSQEAARLDATRRMMRSYWMTGLYFLIFAVSALVFVLTTGLMV